LLERGDGTFGWLTGTFVTRFLTYFWADELINDYEVTTVWINDDGVFHIPKKTRRKNCFGKNMNWSHRYDGS
jgi:hypothetical protein